MERGEAATSLTLQLGGREFIITNTDELLAEILCEDKPVALMYVPSFGPGIEDCTLQGHVVRGEETEGIGLVSRIRVQQHPDRVEPILNTFAQQLKTLAKHRHGAEHEDFEVLETPDWYKHQIIDIRTGVIYLVGMSHLENTIIISNYGEATDDTSGETEYLAPPESSDFDTADALEAYCRLLNFTAETIAGQQELIPDKRGTAAIHQTLPVRPLAITAVPSSREVAIHSEQPRASAFDAIGGMHEPKRQLTELAAIYRDPRLLQECAEDLPRGILLYGPAGTGKTELAKAFAKEIDAKVIEINVDSFDSMWVSEGPRNLRKLFAEAKEATDMTVLLFDELDGIVPNSSSTHSHDNQVSGIFKQELADIARNHGQLLVVATTNRDLQSFDKAIIRSGRFDLHIPVLEPNVEERIDIFGTYLQAMAGTKEIHEVFADDIDLPQLASLTDTLTGADISAIFRRMRLQRKLQALRSHEEPLVRHMDFVRAIHEYRRHIL